ncbi:MAG: Ig-like domain-containing protein, partial [Burkholderiales bacterium]
LVFEGIPEFVEEYKDPDTQEPLLDPVTGEYMFDPETGELLLDPNTGTTLHFVLPAVPAVYSGTRYIVSDESIASVSADGLITALRAGTVTVSIVHLASSLDASGYVTEQVIGQSDITLTVQAAQVTDEDPLTPAPQRIAIGTQGGVVAASTGEAVLVGAGALREDTQIGIRRIELANLEALTGLPAPAPQTMQAIGAFSLDLGERASAVPVQLAIPVQGGAQAGEEIFFFRRGVFIDELNVARDTWWLVDNGFIGQDGIARTASPPHTGVQESGEYVVVRRNAGLLPYSLEVALGVGTSAFFGGMGFSLAGVGVAIEVSGILSSLATPAHLTRWILGVPQAAEVVVQADPAMNTRVNLETALPALPTPYGNLVLPNIEESGIEYLASGGEVKITFTNDNPGEFVGKIAVRVLFPDGTHQDLKTIEGDASGSVSVSPPANIAIGGVRWQLVRKLPADHPNLPPAHRGGEPVEFGGNSARLSPEPDMAAVLTRTGVTFLRQNKVVGEAHLINTIGEDLGFEYLTGAKVQPIAFSGDLSRAYVAGNAKIYVIDLVSFKLIHTVKLDAGANIASLIAAGDMLLAGEGRSYGQGASGLRLLALDMTPRSKLANVQPVTLNGSGIEATALGISGMAIGPDGYTLVVSAPRIGNVYGNANGQARGDILLFDLRSVDLTRGTIGSPVVAALAADGLSGKGPSTISATRDADRFLVSTPNDYDRGLSTLVIERGDEGEIQGASLSAVVMRQPNDLIKLDRLDIQRAQSAVLVKYEDVEYALVSDDNYNFKDPYWNAMFEAPMFMVLSPGAPPTAIGGSASAKSVNVGGKIGVVKDPFGAAQYLGATLPLDGYGIINLSLSDDGKVVIGQLKGGYGTADQFTQKPHISQAWNVAALIEAATTQLEKDRFIKHFTPKEAKGKLPVMEIQGSYTAYTPAGTAFDPIVVEVTKMDLRMGDVTEIDLRNLVGTKLGWSERERQELRDFRVDPLQLPYLTGQGIQAQIPQIKIATDADTGSILSRNANPAFYGEFRNEGVFYAAPNLVEGDILALREGRAVPEKLEWFTVYATRNGERYQLIVTLRANDFTPAVINPFFGDRPLDNPGYSKFDLKGSVGRSNAENISLDVWRVEQRLKYFGYPVIKTNASNTIKDFKVDGQFAADEETALKFFETLVRYESVTETGRSAGAVEVDIQMRATVTAVGKAKVAEVPGSFKIISAPANVTRQALTAAKTTAKNAAVAALTNLGFTNNAIIAGADGIIESDANATQQQTTMGWLNAYNAPHWMSFEKSFTAGESGLRIFGHADN